MRMMCHAVAHPCHLTSSPCHACASAWQVKCAKTLLQHQPHLHTRVLAHHTDAFVREVLTTNTTATQVLQCQQLIRFM